MNGSLRDGKVKLVDMGEGEFKVVDSEGSGGRRREGTGIWSGFAEIENDGTNEDADAFKGREGDVSKG